MPNTVSAKKCFWNLRQYLHIGFQLVRFQCFPWLVLAIAPLKLLFASEVERIHEQVRYLNAISRIDFVGVYGLLNDLLW
jgi:hypothetical protein